MDHQLTRTIPLETGWDVIVVGGGPAGCTAAAAAAREGARTLLLEQSQALGGSGTSALVPAWCPFSDKEKIIYRGLAERVFRASWPAHVPESQLDWVAIDPEKLKRVYDDLVTEAGATVRFGSFLSGVERDASGQATALIVSNKRGLSAIRAKVFVDCTGDGDLAAWRGPQFQKGDEHGEMQAATHCFVLSNVDEEALARAPWLHANTKESAIHKIVASEKYPTIVDPHICQNKIGPRTFGFNAGHVYRVDNTDPQSVSRGVIEGRKLAESFQAALAEFMPEAFGQSFLVTTGAQIGIRETRRITGDYILTLPDWMARRKFDDEICRNAYFIDLHMTATEIAQNDQYVDIENRFKQYGPGESHGIPYRCLTPVGLRNVLVAGRCISVDRTVHGSIRVMPVCLAMGEAAGMAAAHAVQHHGGDVHAVDTQRLRERLRAEGGYLP